MYTKISFDLDGAYDSGTHSRRHVTLPLVPYKDWDERLNAKSSILKALGTEQFSMFDEESCGVLSDVNVTCTSVGSSAPALSISVPFFFLLENKSEWYLLDAPELNEWLEKILPLPPYGGSAS